MASPAYRVPARLRDYITARDVTCRFTTCRQPVWCCDIDHTQPYDQGGRTCKCNNGGLCRTHHQIKQLPGGPSTSQHRASSTGPPPADGSTPPRPTLTPSEQG